MTLEKIIADDLNEPEPENAFEIAMAFNKKMNELKLCPSNSMT